MHKTQAELAKAMRVNQSTISRWLADKDCPVSTDGPWDADDIVTLRDWRAAQEDEGDDTANLKRAQALKAQTLSVKYTLAMLTEVGKLGDDLFTSFGMALCVAMVRHFQNSHWQFSSILSDLTGIDQVRADRIARDFVYTYALGYSQEVAHSFKFKNRVDETLRPVIVHAEKVVREIREMGQMDESVIRQVEEATDKAANAARVDDGEDLLHPPDYINPWGPSDLAPTMRGHSNEPVMEDYDK